MNTTIKPPSESKEPKQNYPYRMSLQMSLKTNLELAFYLHTSIH